jgi:organic radical activating enzyme
MSKKKLDIAGKINTVPKQLTVEEIESAIKQVHKKEVVKEPKKEIKKPVKAAIVVEEKPIIAAKVKERKVRLSIDISPQLHKRLKIRAVENDTNVMYYVEKLIEKDLNG